MPPWRFPTRHFSRNFLQFKHAIRVFNHNAGDSNALCCGDQVGRPLVKIDVLGWDAKYLGTFNSPDMGMVQDAGGIDLR